MILSSIFPSSYQNSNIKVVTGYKSRITLKDTEQTIALTVNKTHYTFAIITFIINSYTKNTAITSTRLNNGFSEAVIINSLEGDIIPISINFSENNKMIFKLPKKTEANVVLDTIHFVRMNY